MTPDCAGFGFVYKAHPPVPIKICAGGCNAVGGPKGKQGDVIISGRGLKAVMDGDRKVFRLW